MAEQNCSDHATNVTETDGNATDVDDIRERPIRTAAEKYIADCLSQEAGIVERLRDMLDVSVPMYVTHQDIRDVINEIERLYQKEYDILAGIQLVVKGSNAGRDEEIQRLNTELESFSLSLDEFKNLINNLTDVSSRLAALVLQIPCKCEESNDGAVDALCPMCSAYMDWEGVMKRVG